MWGTHVRGEVHLWEYVLCKSSLSNLPHPLPTYPKLICICIYVILLTLWRACTARVIVLGLCVCLSVTTILAMRRPKSNTNGFSAMQPWILKRQFSWNYCIQKLWCETSVKKTIYQWVLPHFDRSLPLCTTEVKVKLWVKDCIQTLLSSRSKKRLTVSVRLWTSLCACVYITLTCA